PCGEGQLRRRDGRRGARSRVVPRAGFTGGARFARDIQEELSNSEQAVAGLLAKGSGLVQRGAGPTGERSGARTRGRSCRDRWAGARAAPCAQEVAANRPDGMSGGASPKRSAEPTAPRPPPPKAPCHRLFVR